MLSLSVICNPKKGGHFYANLSSRGHQKHPDSGWKIFDSHFLWLSLRMCVNCSSKDFFLMTTCKAFSPSFSHVGFLGPCLLLATRSLMVLASMIHVAAFAVKICKKNSEILRLMAEIFQKNKKKSELQKSNIWEKKPKNFQLFDRRNFPKKTSRIFLRLILIFLSLFLPVFDFWSSVISTFF